MNKNKYLNLKHFEGEADPIVVDPIDEGNDPNPAAEVDPNVKPEPTGDPKSTPFKVFETQEEFDNHAAGIKRNAANEVFKTLGIKSASDITQMKSEYESKLNEAETKVQSLRVTNTLLGSGIAADNLDYAMVDIKKAGIDINDSKALAEFAGKSKWIAKQQTTNQTQQVVHRYGNDSISDRRKALMFGNEKIRK